MKLYLIRHAQSFNNAVHSATNRVCDPPLTELGRRQADVVAAHIQAGRESSNDHEAFDFTRLICSPMTRALETARAISAAVQVPVDIWSDVHETHGIWIDKQDGKGPRGCAGIKRSRIETEFPGFGIPHDVSEEGWWNRPPETPEQWRARAIAVTARIRNEILPSGNSAAVIIHGWFLIEMLSDLLFDTPPNGALFGSGNTSITRVTFEERGKVSLDYLNRVDHLPEELKS